jgi:hypothetical protein
MMFFDRLVDYFYYHSEFLRNKLRKIGIEILLDKCVYLLFVPTCLLHLTCLCVFEALIYCPTPDLTQYVGDQQLVHYCNGLGEIVPVFTQPADTVYNHCQTVMRLLCVFFQ